MSEEQRQADRIRALNATPGQLKYVDCPICLNRGFTVSMNDEGNIVTRRCSCMAKRRSMQRIASSGLSDILGRYTLDAYAVTDRDTELVKRAAQDFIGKNSGWFFICGKPGSGKTHICTAICGELMARGRELRYMLWRETAPRLKALVNEREEYEHTMDELKSIEVLYIDDFLKGTVTDADINIAFELLNARYNSAEKITIISTEKNLGKIIDIDEAIGSRIYERSRGFCLKAPGVNRRLE